VKALFHPLVESWFAETYREPTAVQNEAWPLIEKGEHVLVIAPTGSGKTLAAFLAAISRFMDGTWDPAKLCCLYVSPLKALNEDIRRNLLEPLDGLRKKAGTDRAFPAVRVETRSGDTPQAERRRFLVHPPSILAVTPESLSILLLNPRGREVLSTVKYLVLDEIHAVMGTKRGAFLSCQIDRLSLIAGEFQRVALTATVNPPELAAEFSGGFIDIGGGNRKRRKLHIISPQTEKKIDFLVEFPAYPDAPDSGLLPESAAGPEKRPSLPDRYGKRYTVLVNYILERIRSLNKTRGGENDLPPGNEREGRHAVLLVFTDSRRRCERISYLLNQAAGEQISLCHHGSLSKEIRREVEQSLAAGRIPCVIATASLELGIDIGAVDEVLLAGGVSGCTQALQRIGRAGHGVGRTSRARLVPFHGMDLAAGAALAGAVADRELEEIRLVKNPLDVLAQIILALASEKPRTAEELYRIITGFETFSDLPRSAFDRVIAMLTGRRFGEENAGIVRTNFSPNRSSDVSDSSPKSERIRELRPRLFVDIDGTCHAADGVVTLLYSSGGVIPNRGLYSMRLGDGTKIGELDEEFVFERRLGDSFDFGSRSWNIIDIGGESITVVPTEASADFQPFWKADTPFRSPVITRRLLGLFDGYESSGGKTAGGKTPAPPGSRRLPEASLRHVGNDAAEALQALLEKQRAAQGVVRLPGQAYIPVEIIDDAAVRPDSCQVVFHTFRGGALNYPLGFALAGLLEEKTGSRIEAVIDDNAVLVLIPRIALRAGSSVEALLAEILLELPRKGETCFLKRLESSGIFGAAFREAAELSLIIPRGNFGRRIPLWITRQRAKRLYDKVSGSDFPALTEAWRICLADRFDMEGFRELLENLGVSIKTGIFRSTAASPFSRDLAWKETGAFMYEYDGRSDILGRPGEIPQAPAASGRHVSGGRAAGAVAAALGDPSLRPRIGGALAASFAAKLRRELPGWTPEEPLALAEWVRERIAIPADEWETLTAALPEKLQEELREDPGLGGRIAKTTLPGAAVPVIRHCGLPPEKPGDHSGADAFPRRLGEWLRYEGPVSARRIAAVFGCTAGEAGDAANGLVETGEAVCGIIIDDEEDLFCDAENFELLLNITRKKARPQVRERKAVLVTPFLSLRQGLIPENSFAFTDGENRSIIPALAVLSCYTAPAPLWETGILPARIHGYKPESLDSALALSRCLWFGAGKERIGFCAPDELELMDLDVSRITRDSGLHAMRIIAAFCGSYRNFWEIRDELVRQGSAKDSRTAVELLWEAVWASLLSSDSFQAVRRGLERGFIPKHPGEGGFAGRIPAVRASRRFRSVPKALREKWREGAPVPGNWFSLLPGPELDESRINHETSCHDSAMGEFSALETAELNQDRVRLLLRRWGILARPLLERENSALSWAALLPAMRRMELAGELVTGRFVEGIHSLQFASPSIGPELEAAEDVSSVYWMNAADPASPAGLDIDGLDKRLPSRTANAALCFRGSGLLAVSTKNGRELELFIPPDDSDYRKVVAFITAPRRRVYAPVRKLAIDTINGDAATESPWASVLETEGFIADRGKLFLW
jgi:ATP-dependent Lhr-like helicase